MMDPAQGERGGAAGPTIVRRARATLHVDPVAFDDDPYPTYEAARAFRTPVWLEPMGYWLDVDYGRVQRALTQPEVFTTVSDRSPIRGTLGSNMLTTDGAEQARQRAPFRPTFNPAAVLRDFEQEVADLVSALIDTLDGSETELRSSLAARLPIQTILRVFGLPPDREAGLREIFDAFERALADFSGIPDVTAAGAEAYAGFTHLITTGRSAAGGGLLDRLLAHTDGPPSAETVSNLAIVFFGGISTVEALLLNLLWALGSHPAAFARLRHDPALIAAAVEETMRWQSPVQTATRFAVADAELGGQAIAQGEMVSFALAGANRDAAVFPDPHVFDFRRPNLRRHLGFATGAHFCLGSYLARLEVATAMRPLVEKLPGLQIDLARSARPAGAEFRRPRHLTVNW